MGISSAQAIRLNVQEASIDNSGVYAIWFSPPFKTKKPSAGGGKGLPLKADKTCFQSISL